LNRELFDVRREFLVIEEVDQSAKVLFVFERRELGEELTALLFGELSEEEGMGVGFGAGMQTCFLTCNNEHTDQIKMLFCPCQAPAKKIGKVCLSALGKRKVDIWKILSPRLINCRAR